MNRTNMPTEIRRAVLVEAGHRCAIPTCKHPEAEVHHIISWEKCESHDFENLIALCPNCHNRADSGKIDRKSLRIYKSQLSASSGAESLADSEDKGVISESALGHPGYEFDYQYPIFNDLKLRPVSLQLESMGFDMLFEHRKNHHVEKPFDPDVVLGPDTTSAAFQIIRNDKHILSIKYRVHRYFTGAMHGIGTTISINYLRNPLIPILVDSLFSTDEWPNLLSTLSREILIDQFMKDPAWVETGTEAIPESFNSFNISPKGIMITFDEYQVDCYAAGPQVIEIPISDLVTKLDPMFRSLWG